MTLSHCKNDFLPFLGGSSIIAMLRHKKYLFSKKELVLIIAANEQKNNRETDSVIQPQG